MRDRTYQKDLDGSQDVHGSSKGSAQVETQAHGAPELWPQRAADHEVGPPGWMDGSGGMYKGREATEENKKWGN